MSRDRVLRTIAASLQPKGMEIPYRRKSDDGRPSRVRPEVAAGALAFRSVDREVDGETLRGDTFRPLLLRLKYAEHRSKRLFIAALEQLLARHGGLVRRGHRNVRNCSETMYAVALTALFEWVHDGCPKCRKARQRAGRPTPCACVARMETRRSRASRADPWEQRDVPVGAPLPGCRHCGGTGKVFERRAEDGRGLWCVTCRNSGRTTFPPKQRWSLVSDYLRDAARKRGEEPRGFKFDTYATHWQNRYHRFIDALRAVDKSIAEGLDLRIVARGGALEEVLHEIEEPEE